MIAGWMASFFAAARMSSACSRLPSRSHSASGMKAVRAKRSAPRSTSVTDAESMSESSSESSSENPERLSVLVADEMDALLCVRLRWLLLE